MEDQNQNYQPEAPAKPEKPDIAKQEEYEFNLGLYRIETLSEILEVCAKKYRSAIMERDEESINDYQAMVNLLFTETFIYMKQETGFEEAGAKMEKEKVLKDHLDDFQKNLTGKEDKMQQLQKIRKIYLEVRGVLQEVGIDIPKKEKIGDTEVFS